MVIQGTRSEESVPPQLRIKVGVNHSQQDGASRRPPKRGATIGCVSGEKEPAAKHVKIAPVGPAPKSQDEKIRDIQGGGRWELGAAVRRSLDEAGEEISKHHKLGERLFAQALACSDRADVVFELSDGQRPFRGHSCVLIAMCEEYASLFGSGGVEKEGGVVRVPAGISLASFRGFLEFLYLGRCGEACGQADGRELAVLSEMYQVGGLREWLLSDGVGTENLCVALEFGLLDQGDRADVISVCLERAKGGLGNIGESLLKGTTATIVKGLLGSRLGPGGGVSRARVAEGFEFVQRWVAANGGLSGSPKGEVEGIVGMLDLGKLSKRYLSETVKGSGLVAEKRYNEVTSWWAPRFDREFDIERVFGSEGRGQDQFRRIWNVAVHGEGGAQRVAGIDYDMGRVVMFKVEGGEFAGSAGCKGQDPGQFDMPAGAAFNSKGELFVSDFTMHRIQVFDMEGAFLRYFGGRGCEPGQLDGPHGLAFTADDQLVVADNRNSRIQVFREDGTFVREIGRHGSADGELDRPVGVCVGPDGKVYVGDAGNHRVQVFDISGAFVMKIGGGEGTGLGQFLRPLHVGVGRSGHVLVADASREDLQAFRRDGSHVQTIGGSLFKHLGGMCVDQEGHIFIVCRASGQIVMLS